MGHPRGPRGRRWPRSLWAILRLRFTYKSATTRVAVIRVSGVSVDILLIIKGQLREGIEPAMEQNCSIFIYARSPVTPQHLRRRYGY